MEAILTQGLHAELMVPVVTFIAEQSARAGTIPQAVFATMTPLQMFVMSRGIIGVLRAAVLEEQPFFKSRPGDVLLALTLVLVPVALLIPYLPHAAMLGFVPLPARLLGALVLVTVAYSSSAELLKAWFYRRAR